MPYSPAHKPRTRARIVECARELFNRDGFEAVTIDMVMARAHLTRGGFYNHFENKHELFAEAVASFLRGRGAQWRSEAGVGPHCPPRIAARRMVESYLSAEHLNDVEGQCPLIALPADVARGEESARSAYCELLTAMVDVFEQSMALEGRGARREGLVLAALSVGGMSLARTMPKTGIAEEVREAALAYALELIDAR